MVGAHDLEAGIEQVKKIVDAVLIRPDDARRVGFQHFANVALAPFKIPLFGIELSIAVADRGGSGIMAALDGFQTEQLHLGGIGIATTCRRLYRLNGKVRRRASRIVSCYRTYDLGLMFVCGCKLRRFKYRLH